MLGINLKKLRHVILEDPQDYNLEHSKSFFRGSFICIFFTPKFMKFRWYSFFWGSFAHHFQIKLSTDGSNLNSTFVSISELEFFLLTKVLTQNSNIVELVKFLGKNKKLHIQMIVVILKMTPCKITSKKFLKGKKVNTQDFMGKTNFFYNTLSFSPSVVLATWLHVGALEKI